MRTTIVAVMVSGAQRVRFALATLAPFATRAIRRGAGGGRRGRRFVAGRGSRRPLAVVRTCQTAVAVLVSPRMPVTTKKNKQNHQSTPKRTKFMKTVKRVNEKCANYAGKFMENRNKVVRDSNVQPSLRDFSHKTANVTHSKRLQLTPFSGSFQNRKWLTEAHAFLVGLRTLTPPDKISVRLSDDEISVKRRHDARRLFPSPCAAHFPLGV